MKRAIIVGATSGIGNALVQSEGQFWVASKEKKTVR
tara:strand:+ start:17081 stop:17188 length:108 start_codon:yes stop_codon:yes gene_type:complete